MSAHNKFNTAVASVVLSALGTAISVIWMASAKAKDIDTCREDIEKLTQTSQKRDIEMNEQAKILSRLDERTIAILREIQARN